MSAIVRIIPAREAATGTTTLAVIGSAKHARSYAVRTAPEGTRPGRGKRVADEYGLSRYDFPLIDVAGPSSDACPLHGVECEAWA